MSGHTVINIYHTGQLFFFFFIDFDEWSHCYKYLPYRTTVFFIDSDERPHRNKSGQATVFIRPSETGRIV